MGDLELDLDGTRVRGKCQAKGSEVYSLEIFWREEKAERNEERREVEEVNLR